MDKVFGSIGSDAVEKRGTSFQLVFVLAESCGSGSQDACTRIGSQSVSVPWRKKNRDTVIHRVAALFSECRP
jgi:hypothetical protein